MKSLLIGIAILAIILLIGILWAKHSFKADEELSRQKEEEKQRFAALKL